MHMCYSFNGVEYCSKSTDFWMEREREREREVKGCINGGWGGVILMVDVWVWVGVREIEREREREGGGGSYGV